MPLRKIVFASGETYHVLNRGVASMPIFKTPTDYRRFIALIDFYRFTDHALSFSRYNRLPKNEKDEYRENLLTTGVSHVGIFAYCLMQNHFHILLNQAEEDGIIIFFRNLQNAYGKYFNIRNQREGPLFQSRFKAVRIESDKLLLHVSRYIHLNPSTSYLVEPERLSFYEWSSYPEYLGKRKSAFSTKDEILGLAGSPAKYEEFVLNQADYQRELRRIKHVLLEK